MEGRKRMAWTDSRRGISEKFPVGMRIICYLSILCGGFNFANISGFKPLKFRRLSWKNLWSLVLVEAISFNRYRNFIITKAFFGAPVNANRFSETDVKANYFRFFLLFSAALLSITYWNVRGQALCDLFNEALDLDRWMGIDARRRWFWVVGSLVYSCVWAAVSVLGNVMTPWSPWMAFDIFVTFVVGLNAVTQSVLYAWICSQIVRLQVYSIRELREGRMNGKEWLEGRKSLESLAKKLNGVYGPLVMIHLARNAVLATLLAFLIVRSAAAFGWGSTTVVTFSVSFTCFSIPVLIFFLAAEPVGIQGIQTLGNDLQVLSLSTTIHTLCRSLQGGFPPLQLLMDADGCYKLRRIHLTVSGFFHLGHGPLAELIDMILTYVIVLFQFNQVDQKTKA
ncbi:unnamed protein product [Darwinula stevensoni]|uniref:Uncharacterized protein n=1 Tax=Darwinula stevensoni TaxID=69355 RepID=A0A7R9A722_9CRUS|nr:unnamed protein product [Darwinula stevensoni]CAG0891161.1 unnamed protein product [Darwinula stevensoni]